MHGESQALGTLYRHSAKVVAVESKEELLRLLSHTLRTLFPRLVRFEVLLADESGRLVAVDEGWDPLSAWSPSPRSLRSVPSGIESEAAPRVVEGGSRMSALLLDGRLTLGLIEVQTTSAQPFSAVDVEILESVADLFSLAFLRLRSRHVESRRASIDADRRSAGNVQRSLMAGSLPAGSGVKVDTRYLPAFDVGGDFYDLTRLDDGRIGGAIGDVSGKGVSAALIMSRVSADVGRAMRSGATPSRVLETVNATLTDEVSENFVTAACISIDPRRRRLTIANAGHIPLLIRRAGGEVLDFGRASGTPLGMISCRYADEHLELKPDDIVLLMTDGLVEALDTPSDRMGAECLRRVVNGAPHDPESVNSRILAAARDSNGARPPDDLTLVALQIESR